MKLSFYSLTGAICAALALAACDAPPADSAATTAPADGHYYTTGSGVPLEVAAPGVLANDSGATPDSVVKPGRRPFNGELELRPDGSFTYTPSFRFDGHDSFSYRRVTNGEESAPVNVSIGFPNVIVILADDLGYGDISAINPAAGIATPHLDRLVTGGVSFTNAHAPAAVCAPSRYALLTGNYPQRGRIATGVWNSYEPATMILPNQTTLGDLFRDAGYRTGLVGKLHIGGAFHDSDGAGYTRDPGRIDFTRPFDRGPTGYGFDYSFLLPGGVSTAPYAYFENERLVRFDESRSGYTPFASNAAAHEALLDVEARWSGPLNGGKTGSPGLAMDNYDSRLSGSILTRRDIGFMAESLEARAASALPQPFFLYFAPPQLHTPYTPPDFFAIDDDNDARPATTGTMIAGAAATPRTAMIRELDTMVGAILAFLEEHDQLDSTLIVFSSDNGPLPDEATPSVQPQGFVGGTALRGSKGDIHEGGHRVPLLFYWVNSMARQPAAIAGRSSDALVGLQDMAATFLGLLGQQRASGQFNDSRSVLNEVLANTPDPTLRRTHLIVQGSPKSAADNLNYVDRAFYSYDEAGNLWKLTVVSRHTDPLADLRWESLYNLTNDPGEQRDLLNEPAQRALLDGMQQQYRDLITQPRTTERYL